MFWAVRGRGRGLGVFGVVGLGGLLWVPVAGGLRGNASLPVPFALLVCWRALAGLLGWRVRDATRREVPLRPLDLSRVGLLVSGTAVTPDGSAAPPFAGWRGAELVLHLARRWRAKRIGTSQDRYATSLSCGSSTSPPPWASAYDGAASRARLRDHWRRSRGHDALSDMSDGVYGLLRPHDHGMPGVILDTGSDSVPLWGSALLCTPRDGGWRRGYRRSGPPVGCR